MGNADHFLDFVFWTQNVWNCVNENRSLIPLWNYEPDFLFFPFVSLIVVQIWVDSSNFHVFMWMAWETEVSGHVFRQVWPWYDPLFSPPCRCSRKRSPNYGWISNVRVGCRTCKRRNQWYPNVCFRYDEWTGVAAFTKHLNVPGSTKVGKKGAPDKCRISQDFARSLFIWNCQIKIMQRFR